MWEFAKGNTFGATAFSSYGAFWMSFWWLTGHTDLSELPAGRRATRRSGLYLLAWGIFTAYMTVAATRVSGAVLAVFVLLTLTFLAAGARRVRRPPTGITKIGGYVGLLTALAAWYASFAGVTAFTFGRQVAADRAARGDARDRRPAVRTNADPTQRPRVARGSPAAGTAWHEEEHEIVSDETLSNLSARGAPVRAAGGARRERQRQGGGLRRGRRRPAGVLGEGRPSG